MFDRHLPWAGLQFEAKKIGVVRCIATSGAGIVKRKSGFNAWYRHGSSNEVLSAKELALLLNARVAPAAREVAELAVDVLDLPSEDAPELDPQSSTSAAYRMRGVTRFARPLAVLACGTLALSVGGTSEDDVPIGAVVVGGTIFAGLTMMLVGSITWLIMRRRRSWSFSRALRSRRVAIVTALLIAVAAL
jgi:hypothetical protein